MCSATGKSASWPRLATRRPPGAAGSTGAEGPILLTGDLYHSRENRLRRFIPLFNVNREETLRSMERIETIVEETGARVVIHHATEDFNSLPASPAYLD